MRDRLPTMFKRLRNILEPAAAPTTLALSDRRVFAIGDIHGCDDLLEALIEGIDVITRNDPHPPIIVFLGDYVDRGPSSRQVIDRLIAMTSGGRKARFICGNHEEAMLRFLGDMEGGLAWPGYGGRATMASYGVTCPEDEQNLDAWRTTQAKLKEAIPAEHMKFLWGLEDKVELGGYLFVHAGLRPEKPITAQTQRDLRWIREPFLSDPRPFSHVVVHGHTPASDPHSDQRRIGLDTWAYKTGVLTAVELKRDRRRFFQAKREPDGILVSPWKPGVESSEADPANTAPVPGDDETAT